MGGVNSSYYPCYPQQKQSILTTSGFCHQHKAEFPTELIQICCQFYGVKIIDLILLNDNTSKYLGKYNMEKLIYKLFKSPHRKQYYLEYVPHRAELWKIIFLEQYNDPYPNYHINEQQYNDKSLSITQHHGVEMDTNWWLTGLKYDQLPLNKDAVKRIHNTFIDNYSDIEQSFCWSGTVYLTYIINNIFSDNEYLCYLCLSSLLLRIYPIYHTHHSNYIMMEMKQKYGDQIPSGNAGLHCAFQLIIEILKIYDNTLQCEMDKLEVLPILYVYPLKLFLYKTFKDPLIIWDFILLNGIEYLIIIVVVMLIDKKNGVRQRLQSIHGHFKSLSFADWIKILRDIFNDSKEFEIFIPDIYKMAGEIERKYPNIWNEMINHAVDMNLVKHILPRGIRGNTSYGNDSTNTPDFSKQPNPLNYYSK